MLNRLRQFFHFLTKTNPNIEQEVDDVIAALGGLDNILQSGACATRLRMQLNDTERVDSEALKQLGAFGVVRLDNQNVQVIFGLKANSYSQLIEQKLQQLK